MEGDEGGARPVGLRLVHFFIFRVLFLDRLLLLLLHFFVSIFIFTDIFNLGFLFLGFSLLLHLFLGFIVADFQVAFLLHQQSDGVTDELGVFLDYLLDAFLLKI